MDLSIIAAIGKNGEIGLKNKLPWNIPEDLKRFKDLTEGNIIIMGRRTFESIGHPLSNRKNIIITRNRNFISPEDCIVANSVEEAIKIAEKNGGESFIIGGKKIYQAALPFVEKMYITKIAQEFEADTYFPEIDLSEWKVSEISIGHRQEREGQILDFSYLTYERIKQ